MAVVHLLSFTCTSGVILDKNDDDNTFGIIYVCGFACFEECSKKTKRRYGALHFTIHQKKKR
jgi:hypothetical protein